jgi:hypothetical protein
MMNHEDLLKYILYTTLLNRVKATVNNREVSKETEPDLVLIPASYWRLFLKLNLEKVLLLKTLAKSTVEPSSARMQRLWLQIQSAKTLVLTR